MTSSAYVPGNRALSNFLSRFDQRFAIAAKAAADDGSLVDMGLVLEGSAQEPVSLVSFDGSVLASWVNLPSGHSAMATTNWVRKCVWDTAKAHDCRIMFVTDAGLTDANAVTFESGERRLVTIDGHDERVARSALSVLIEGIDRLSVMSFDQDGFVAQ